MKTGSRRHAPWQWLILGLGLGTLYQANGHPGNLDDNGGHYQGPSYHCHLTPCEMPDTFERMGRDSFFTDHRDREKFFNIDDWDYEQDFHGDSWVDGDDGVVVDDGGGVGHPSEADTFGGGEIEMQVLGGKRTTSITADSFKDMYLDDSLQKVTPFGEKSLGLTKDGSPIFFDDLPEVPEFSWDSIDLGSASPEAQALFAETLSDPSTMSLGAEGIGTSLSGIRGFVRNRLIDVVGGQLLMPMFNWLDGITGNPWASRVIQGSMATFGLVAAGDPFGVIAAPICWGIQEYMKQRQRLIANDDPEADRGRKFGYVREGDKWYPAIQTSKERDEGWIGSTIVSRRPSSKSVITS